MTGAVVAQKSPFVLFHDAPQGRKKGLVLGFRRVQAATLTGLLNRDRTGRQGANHRPGGRVFRERRGQEPRRLSTYPASLRLELFRVLFQLLRGAPTFIVERAGTAQALEDGSGLVQELTVSSTPFLKRAPGSRFAIAECLHETLTPQSASMEHRVSSTTLCRALTKHNH